MSDTTEITCAIDKNLEQYPSSLHTVQLTVFLNDTTSNSTAGTQLMADGLLTILICEIGCSSHVQLFHNSIPLTAKRYNLGLKLQTEALKIHILLMW